MKLKLTQQSDVTILDVLENIEPKSGPILHAGIKKIFQSGKNKIILNLTDTKMLSKPFIKEVMQFNSLAELSGQIVIVSKSEILTDLEKTEGAQPLKFFASIEQAVMAFMMSAEAAIPDEPAPQIQVDPNDPHAEIKIELAKVEARNAKLKARLQGLKIDEFEKLRSNASKIQLLVTSIREEIETLKKDKKPAKTSDDAFKKVKLVEKVLCEVLAPDNLFKVKG